MPSSIKPKTLDRQCAKIGQYVDYAEIVALGPERLRVELRSDPYQEQCYARVALWSGGKWQMVHSILPTLMKTPDKLAAHPFDEAKCVQTFKADRDKLLDVAREVLFTD